MNATSRRLKTEKKDLYPQITKLAQDVKDKYKVVGVDKFLPYDMLQELVTADTVRVVLQNANVMETEIEGLVNFVLNHGAKRLFLILVLMTTKSEEQLSLLLDLKDGEVTDESLPLAFSPDNQKKYYGYSLEKAEPDERQFSLFNDWDDNEWEKFDHYQWPFIAPVFRANKFRYHFAKLRPLPYLQVAQHPASSGFFGEVSRAEIHPAHLPALSQNYSAGADGIAIAIKKARDDDELKEYFDKEADNLKKVQQIKSPHLIQPIAAYQIGNERCLIFPWADGGNLSDYWESYQNDRSKLESLQWIMSHNHNCRHGDLKPENILWFKNGQDKGTLQIADMGLAKFHEKDADTKKRNLQEKGTQTPSGTSRYEPPEMDEQRNTEKSRSRQYDIWSMGCIMLELLIWLIYGFEAVRTFRKYTPYFFTWTREQKTGQKNYIIQLDGDTAYKALLHLVRYRLLVPSVSESYKSSPEHREIATELHKKMLGIYQTCLSDNAYLPPRQPGTVFEVDGKLAAPNQVKPVHMVRIPQPPPSIQISTPESDDIPRLSFRAPTVERDLGSLSTQEPKLPDKQEQSRKPNDVWESSPDNVFASDLFDLIKWDRVKPDQQETRPTLCQNCSQNCRQADSTRIFSTKCFLSQLKLTSRTCDLCRLLQGVLKTHGHTSADVISLRQNGAVVGIEGGPDLLSIYYEPDLDIPQEAQLGLPKLFEHGSQDQFTLLKEWIWVCDLKHDGCHRHDEGGGEQTSSTMPTRLLELGEPLRLVDSASIQPSRYVALSHCWGKLKEVERFCTYKHNISQLRDSIVFNKLPKTFQDAIMVARGIEVNYLWIDSLCIIQDDKEDWESEAARMEQVFSNAYCTIGASSAKSAVEGFLKYRPPRPCVELQSPNVGTIYVCPNIDDFNRDVELGELNSRGWVLQERALSRRSIFYTSTQVYWECGAGVHCETLARLQNSRAAFLGDANFPYSALEYYRDGRQMLVQDLYERYSGLAFTKSWDRSVAILGLQDRLARAFKTQAAFGFFDMYFARLLLWMRRDSRPMARIAQRPGSRHRVPTWSWFSREGAIKYMKLEFQRIEWAKEEFKSPFKQNCQLELERQRSCTFLGLTGDGTSAVTLRGLARRFSMEKIDMLVNITFDEEQDFEVEDLRCVIIGRDKEERNTEVVKYHVLIIYQVGRVSEEAVYERVGVASLKPEHVATEGSWVTIR
ncbi:hypothetical protein F5Y19DRAFT_491226 [Xylariaceae sp. FL1651]|nr:hypothetical protein F5Y19DRAFT_491226 [Xylariaceae sp. FL1651]